MQTMTHNVTLTVQECCNCHVTFAIPKEWDDALQQSHATFYCPAGHGQSYTGKTAIQKAEDEAKRLRTMLSDERAYSSAQYDQLKATERSLAGHKAAKTRIKNRIAAGCARAATATSSTSRGT